MLPYEICVVIPYYQRKPGLLRSALVSIREQSLLVSGQCTILVAIVDDASPVPAADELAGLPPSPGLDIVVKHQPNGGAGAARNTALEMLDEACEFVAFLDSDDAWTPDHLSRALAAMQSGADFYFCDAVRGEGEPSENDEPPAWFTDGLRRITDIESLYHYDGPADLSVVKGMVPTTSTIVHRRRRNGGARFPSRYFRFGEDQSYCLQYLAEGGAIAYSSSVGVLCGRGVNIFAGNAPGSEGQRLCFLDEIAFRKDALATLPLSAEARKHVETKLVDARIQLLKQGLWQVSADRGRWLAASILAQPSLALHFPRAVSAWLQERRCLRTTSA